jgi:hypothetical protein
MAERGTSRVARNAARARTARFAASLAALVLLVVTAIPAGAVAPLQWTRWQHVPAVLDLAGPRSDGSLVVAAADRLFLLDPLSGRREPFAAGAGGYLGAGGGEPYIALSGGLGVAAASCSFGRDDLFVLQLKPAGGVLRIDPQGHAHGFATVDGVESLNGIAFDTVGRFGNRLLVTGPSRGATVVAAIDCRGQVTRITDTAPVLEGGIQVAPAGFGSFGGDLVAPDELSGNLYAIGPDGSSARLARSGLPTGGDIGVEGVGFVPPGFVGGGAAYFADRSTPGNPHPGTDSLLRLESGSLAGAGVREGDLLVATEGGAGMIDVRCQRTCQVAELVSGDTAHGEGRVLAVAATRAQPGKTLPEASDLGRSAIVQRWLTWGAIAAIGILSLTALALIARRRRP